MPKDMKNDKAAQKAGQPKAGAQRVSAKKAKQGTPAAAPGMNPKGKAEKQPRPAKGPAARNAASARPVRPGMPRKQPGVAGGPLGGAAAMAAANKKRTILLVAGVLVIAVVIWVLVWMFACSAAGLYDADAQNGQAPYKTAEEIQAELDRQVEEGMFNISIASVIEFADGQSSGIAYIENVPGNRYDMQVTITDDDTGDVLYESGVLQPNQFIESISLTKDLDAGQYPATATFTALDQRTHEEIGKAAAKVTLTVSS